MDTDIKNQLRKQYKNIRKNVSFRKEKEQAITEKLLPIIRNAKTVFCYESIGGEVSTSDLIAQISEFADVYIPIVDGKNMRLYCRKTDKYTDTCEYTIVPLIAFSESRDRIGFGGGYYDRYLADNITRSIGIAFDEQQCEPFETEITDIKPDIIITPTRILK